MENKDPIKITSTIITFVICLTGAVLCYWLYTQIIQSPSIAEDISTTKLQIDTKRLETVKAPAAPTIDAPKSGYGRANPFMDYK